MAETKLIKCPKCKTSDFVTPISYGYPSSEMWEKRNIGEIVLGGCSIKEEAPDYRCTECQFEWQKGKKKKGKYVDVD